MDKPGKTARPLRADAKRNRANVLRVAIAAFAEEGLSVSIHEIARRAGVGTGTVSRHFPTKDALYEAIVLARLEYLVTRAGELAASREPGEAFFDFLSVVLAEGSTNQGLVDAFSGAGFDIEAAVAGSEHDFGRALGDLLASARSAGAVRSDVDPADVKAVIEGCMARERHGTDEVARERMLAMAIRGLRA